MEFITHLFLLCDCVITDKNTGKISIINMFNRIQTKEIPFIYTNMSVILMYSGINGVRDYNLKIFSYNNNTISYNVTGKFHSSDKVSPMYMIFNLANIAFGDSGVHQLELWLDSKVCAETKLDIVKIEEDGGHAK